MDGARGNSIQDWGKAEKLQRQDIESMSKKRWEHQVPYGNESESWQRTGKTFEGPFSNGSALH